jgi:hypothetical protein
MSATSKHADDCGGTWCDYCGCCEHGDDGRGCRAAEAPQGMACPGSGCGCEGEAWYDAPTPPPAVSDDDEGEPREVQLHQETALDLGDWSAA